MSVLKIKSSAYLSGLGHSSPPSRSGFLCVVAVAPTTSRIHRVFASLFRDDMLSFRHSIDKISSCVCPTGTTLDSGKVIIFLIAVRLQIAIRESVQKCNCVIFGSGFCIVIQNDRRQSIFAGAEHPHERICFRISFRLIQNLNPCFIGHKVFSTQKLPMKMIIHRFEVMIGTIDDPVGKCCTGKRNSELLPILFLPVQRHCICKLLVHCPADSRCRSSSCAGIPAGTSILSD